MRHKLSVISDAKASSATQERILDAAEELFMERGFDATSLRQITAKAKVNLAAVNYHFGSKESLVCSVFNRRLQPVVRDRLELLEQMQQAAGAKPLTAEQVLTAFLNPTAHRSPEVKKAGSKFLRLLSWAYTEHSSYIRDFLAQDYTEFFNRFTQAYFRALPHMPKRELVWRLHFMLGTLSYTLAGTGAFHMMLPSSSNPLERGDTEGVMRRLIPFLIAGLEGPLPELAEMSAAQGSPAQLSTV